MCLMAIVILSFRGDLAYRDVMGGQLKMLIPADFINVPKGGYKQHYAGEPTPDDFYCNKDTSEYVALIKLPIRLDDLGHAKQQIGQMALMDTSNKVYFNDTTTINGNKIYLLDLDGTALGKRSALKTFIVNTRNGGSLMGVISCDIALKKAWWPVTDQMLRSIKLN